MGDWYSTREALQMVREFHENWAAHPREMQEANQRHSAIMTELIDFLRERNILKRVEYTGSAYERLKVAEKELEFDAMFILVGGEYLEVERDPHNNLYARLKLSNPAHATNLRPMLSFGEMSPFKVRDKFQSELDKWKNSREARNPVLRGEITLHKNGPAIKMIVYKGGKEWYCVDLVPAFEVGHYGGREIYVAKPKANSDNLWRHSFSVEEKAKMRNIDGHDNGCRKKIIRILKVIRDREPGLHKLVSFYIKCKIIEMSECSPGLNWSEGNLAVRLRDVMLELSNSMAIGYLAHPFEESVNILEDLSCEVRQNIADRLRRIASVERVAKEVLGRNRRSVHQISPEGASAGYDAYVPGVDRRSESRNDDQWLNYRGTTPADTQDQSCCII